MLEIEKIKEFLGSEPFKRVENFESLSLKERFQLFLPNILTEEDKQLLTSFFIYKYTGERSKGEDEERFLELEKMDRVMGGEFLPSTVSKLREINRYMNLGGYTLSSEQFRQLLLNMINDYRVRLDAKDLKILSAVGRNMLLTLTDIAKQTKISYRTVQYHRKKLEERCSLKLVSRVDYSKIGLTNLVVLVKGEADFESTYPLSRYELGFREYTLFSMAIPPKAVKRVKKDFEKKSSTLRFWIANRFENSVSFDNYDTDRGDWNIDWNAWSLYLSNVLSKGWDTVIPQRKEKGETPLLSEPPEKGITAEEQQFIDALLEEFDTPLETLGEKLGCSSSKAMMIKESLLNRGILRPYLSIEHIGLNENILFIVESDKETLDSFAVAVKELPRALIYWMESLDKIPKNSLACWLETPPGSFFPFERSVRLRLRPLAEYMLFFYSH